MDHTLSPIQLDNDWYCCTGESILQNDAQALHAKAQSQHWTLTSEGQAFFKGSKGIWRESCTHPADEGSWNADVFPQLCDFRVVLWSCHCEELLLAIVHDQNRLGTPLLGIVRLLHEVAVCNSETFSRYVIWWTCQQSKSSWERSYLRVERGQ